MVVWAGLALMGCTGEAEDPIPVWQDGVLVQGDCPEDVEAVDTVGVTVTHWRDYLPIPFEEDLPGEYGEVASTRSRFDSLMNALYLYTSVPPDFDEDQVGFAWVRSEDSCGYEHVETHINSKIGGGSILDVTVRDLNCEASCKGAEGGFLIVQSFPNDEPGSVCLRVTPSCDP